MANLAIALVILTLVYGYVLLSLNNSVEELQDRVRELEEGEIIEKES